MITEFQASYAALWALVVFQGLLFLAIVQQLGKLRQLIEVGGLPGENRLPTGSLAPEFDGVDLRTAKQVSSHDFANRGALLLFVSADCRLCKRLADSLRQTPSKGLTSIVTFCQGTERGCSALGMRFPRKTPVVLDPTGEIARVYHVSAFPAAVAFDKLHRIRGYGYPKDAEDVGRLFSAAALDLTSDSEPFMALVNSAEDNQ